MRYIKFFAIIFCLSALLTSFAGCDGNDTQDTTAGDTELSEQPDVSGDVTVSDTVSEDITVAEVGDTSGTEDVTQTYPAGVTSGGEEETSSDPAPIPSNITLAFNGLQCTSSDQSAIRVEDGAFVICKAGTYVLQGDLSDGQVRVSVGKQEKVTLIFNGFTASSSTTAPLYVVSADKVIIELVAGSVNSLTDAELYIFADPADNKPNACIYSSDDLTIKGKGTLVVAGNYNNGIGCKNDLKIKGGNITVSAPNNIIKGNDSVTIEDAKLTLSGGEDAIKTDNEIDADKGYILITDYAEVSLSCADDALQATKSITVDATSMVSGSCGGDVANCPGVISYAEANVTVVSSSALGA